MSTATVLHGDCLVLLSIVPSNSIDAIVTDPPYGLGFMGKKWDELPPGEDWARECLRVLKPGGHLLAFGGTRTWHRLACAVEDAGFEVRDSLAWLYGSGFPKSLDVSKAIDRARDDKADVLRVTSRLADLAEAADITRADIDTHMQTSDMGGWWLSRLVHRCACPSVENWTRLRDFIPGAVELDGEVWRLNGRKGSPGEAWGLREVVGTKFAGIATPGDVDRYTVGGSRSVEVDITAPATPDAARWQGWGTALKPAFEPVVVARKPLIGTVAANVLAHGTGALNVDGCRVEHASADDLATSQAKNPGRSDTVSSGVYGAGRPQQSVNTAGRWPANVILDDDQAAALDESRYFYVAKASKKERPVIDGVAHPTVKPLALMQWLVRLVTPPGGKVLDPFAGSGTTIEAALIEGFNVIGIEREAEYLPLIDARIARAQQMEESA